MLNKSQMKKLEILVGKLDIIERKIDHLRNPETEEWINTEKLCAEFKISRRTAQNWRDKGLLTFTQIGNKILYNRKAIQELMERHSVSANKFNNGN